MLEAPTDHVVLGMGGSGWTGDTGAAWLAGLTEAGALPPCRALVLAADMHEETMTLCRNHFTTFVVDPTKDALASLKKEAARHGAYPTLIHADVFGCSPSLFGPVELIWDRTLFHRLTAPRRAEWAHKTARILPSGGRVLTLLRIGLRTEGPPYAVTEEALTHLMTRHFRIEELTEAGSVPPGAVRTYRAAFRRK